MGTEKAKELYAPLTPKSLHDDVEAGEPLAGETSEVPPNPDDVINAPRMSPLSIFLLFLGYGFRAFGGPIAQINIMREELVVKEQWITAPRFQRVFAAYQVIPGPEATELACYFGVLAGGRLGGLMGGLGFIAPGFALMLAFAWFYNAVGISNPIVASIFAGLQPAVCAMVFRAAHKIGEAVCRHHSTKAVDWRLFLVVCLAALESVLSVNFFITKAHLVILYLMLLRGGLRWNIAAAAWAVSVIAAFIAVIVVKGPMGQLVPQGVGVAAALGNTPGAQFVVGLLGGLVSFGGAYTSIPFIQWETVTSGHWVANQLFLDSLAVCALLPTPLVMFVTMIGYGAGGVVGAVVMTLGMFLPAFVMPIAFHAQLNRLVGSVGLLAHVLDGMAATTVGLICVTAVQLLRTSVTHNVDAILFVGAAHALYSVNSKWTPVLVVGAAAGAGFILYY